MKKISHQLTALLAVCFLALVVLGLFSIYRLRTATANIRAAESKARVNSEIYKSIVQTKDVLADILPPPAYVIESYLVALQLADADGNAESDRLSAQLAQLHKEFSDSYTRWKTTLPEGKLKTAFFKAGEPAMRFYDIVEKQLLPSIATGNRTKVKEIIHTTLLNEYNSQRTEVNKVVACASEQDAASAGELQVLLNESEQAVSAEIRSSITMILLAVVLIMIGDGLFGGYISSRISKSLKLTATSLSQGAEQMTAAAGQVSAASQSLAEGSSEQAASLEETGSSLEEMSSMTKRNADNAQQAKELSAQTRVAADTGASDVEEMKRAMHAIKVSSNEISKIIKTIDEIAFQTNILALNAAVEAARAGEAGAGFAVVADEVRSLAHRAAESARETEGKIEEAIAKSENGVRISGQVAESLSQIVEKARQVDTFIAEIAQASHEQAEGIGQVNTAIVQMDKITQSNASNAEETASAAEELNAQAEALKEAIASLQELVSGRRSTASSLEPAEHTAPSVDSVSMLQSSRPKIQTV